MRSLNNILNFNVGNKTIKTQELSIPVSEYSIGFYLFKPQNDKYLQMRKEADDVYERGNKTEGSRLHAIAGQFLEDIRVYDENS